MDSISNRSSDSGIMAVDSAFERLPREIRHLVYAYSGFSVGGHQWIECPEYACPCRGPSHLTFREHAKWPMVVHGHAGHFLIWRKIEHLLFCWNELFAFPRKLGAMFIGKDGEHVSTNY